MSAERSYMLDDAELAQLSVRWEAGELTLVSSMPMRFGNRTLRVRDQYWVYVVRVATNGDWVWGFKYEA